MTASKLIALAAILLCSSLINGQQTLTPGPLGNTIQGFGGIRTFLRAPLMKLDALDADIAVLGVRFDEGTSYRPGARYGPRDLREASMLYSDADTASGRSGFYYVDGRRVVLKGKRWADLGDVDIQQMRSAITFDNITSAVRGIVGRHAFPVILGGDHSITYGVIRGFDLPSLTVVHLDAHLDSYGDPDQRPLPDHGAWVSYVARLPFVKKFVQIGMRGINNGPRGVERSLRFGSTIVTSEEIHRRGIAAALEAVPSSENIYISLDIDVVDPSIAPGTGTPEADGLTFREISDLLQAIPRKGRVVGMDVVEVDPLYDPTGITAQTAVRLIVDLLGAALPSNDR